MAAAAATAQDDDDGSHDPRPPPAPRRRVSLEEDFFYQEALTSPPARRLSQPPEYSPARFGLDKHGELVAMDEDEPLPQYTCDVALEGVFNMKMEIEDTIKRAEGRSWHQVYVQLRGTALSIYAIKKDWGLNRTGKSGPHISPDNPPWVRKGNLDKIYTLLHADVGIAADYQKRRYVIRVRAETDQFLLSCIELPNFVRWLDVLFAAINISPVLDERDFPRDYSIPRTARLRYFRGEEGVRQSSRGSDAPRPAPVVHHSAMTPRIPPRQPSRRQSRGSDNPFSQPESSRATARIPADPFPSSSPSEAPNLSQSLDPRPGRLSTTSYPNEAISSETGKWTPRHQWTSAHDMVYAKLCYAVLLFRSPRKSNYVIAKGKKWFVDWTTGRMIRVLPPGYFEHEVTGPFQMFSAENRRI
ncbi:PH domain-containing protein [Xylariales sp. AK1849]|nr:PH domain-containing protein [Xylariales sp. AK1849]